MGLCCCTATCNNVIAFTLQRAFACEVMITVVIPTLNAERKLPRCFDSLIAAAVRGVVREVIIADGGSSDSTLAIADAAGAHVEQSPKDRSARLIAGAAAARSDWLLFLYPETALEPGWENEVESFIAQAMPERPRAAVFRFALEDLDVGIAIWRPGIAHPTASLQSTGWIPIVGANGGCRYGAPHRPAQTGAPQIACHQPGKPADRNLARAVAFATARFARSQPGGRPFVSN